MEDGTVVLVGATTENPSFELNAALLSRAQVLRVPVVRRRTNSSSWRSAPRRCWARRCRSTRPPARRSTTLADGDGRALLGLVEEVFAAAKPGEILDTAALLQVVQRRAPIYDKKQDGHYNLISALHKTVRGSDPDAALYYLARMLVAGEDPHVPRPPADPHGDRRHRPGRPAGAAAGDRRARRLPDAGLARGRTGAGAAHRLSRARAQIERGLHRLQGRHGARPARPARRCRRRSSSTRRPR